MSTAAATSADVDKAREPSSRPQNSLIVSISNNSAFYAKIGAKLLTPSADKPSFEEISVTGLGSAIKVAAETAMLMAKNKSGVIKSIETSYYNSDTVRKHVPRINITVARYVESA